MGRLNLRIASFNIRNGRALDGWNSWPLRRRKTRHAIRDLGASIVGLQEVYGFQRRWLKRRLGFHWYGQHRGTGWHKSEANPLLFDPSLRMHDSWTRWYGPTPATPGTRLDGATFPRIATSVVFELAEGPIQVTNTHLDEWSPQRRRASVEQLVGWLDRQYPQVVMGDFNADPDDEMLQLLHAAGLRSALPADLIGTAHAYAGPGHGRVLDYILISSELRAGDAGVSVSTKRPPWPSDHWPVFADITFA